MQNALFVGATGQNVGKTTLCLGIISGMLKRFESVGFTKPVGQSHVIVDSGRKVDKDAILFKKRFNLSSTWEDMSPVIVPGGFTRDFLDGQVTIESLEKQIVAGFRNVVAHHEFTVVEGTGHVGVGSIIGLNNARVASLLGLEMVIIVTGGLGSAIDDLALNIQMCEKYGVPVRGVILNRVIDLKREMILDYVPKALKKWGIPLLGVIPYNEFLPTPTMNDFETLFDTNMLSGERHRWRHCSKMRLVAGSLETFVQEFDPEELMITPASREDIIEMVLELAREGRECRGLILTGRFHPTMQVIENIRRGDIPALYAPITSYDAMKEITKLITKTRIEDEAKVDLAIKLVEPHIDFDKIVQRAVVR